MCCLKLPVGQWPPASRGLSWAGTGGTGTDSLCWLRSGLLVRGHGHGSAGPGCGTRPDKGLILSFPSSPSHPLTARPSDPLSPVSSVCIPLFLYSTSSPFSWETALPLNGMVAGMGELAMSISVANNYNYALGEENQSDTVIEIVSCCILLPVRSSCVQVQQQVIFFYIMKANV